MRNAHVTALAVVEDFTSTARCDEGFLHVRRLRVQNVRADGSRSVVYRVDVVDRPRLDAVAVLVHRARADGAREFLTRLNLRPAAYFRRDRTPAVADPQEFLYCEEIVAGLLEPGDQGLAGVRSRAALEVLEEAGFTVAPGDVELLGPPFFVAPGIISEQIYLAAVDVTGLPHAEPEGDSSPLEESPGVRFRTRSELAAAIDAGLIRDAKTELALGRFLSRHGGQGG